MNSQKKTMNKRYRGESLVNSLVNKLPFEIHISGYNYSGPRTKLSKRLARGDQGVNKLDEACKEHDIAYNNHEDLQERHKADIVLLGKAKERLHSLNASLGEKAAALGVANIMKTKVKLGMGCKPKIQKRKRQILKRDKGLRFHDLTRTARSALKGKEFKNSSDSINVAVKAIKSVKGKRKIKPLRVIPVPNSDGFLPLIPIFAGLGALGLLGGAATIVKAVNAAKEAQKQLKENQRHNQIMETIALNK
jgi:hypothetical protein